MSTSVKIAIIYDFDKTLSKKYMQEYSLIPKRLNMNEACFWNDVKKIAKKNDMDEILAYMYLTLKKAKQKSVKITKKDLEEDAKNIEFFPGVKDWFDRINKYAKKQNTTIEHYIISSGLKEMIQGTAIHNKFKYIFASSYKYNNKNEAEFPAVAINYTTKTQYLFRINKGINNCWDDSKINEFMPENERYIQFKNIIFIGDGLTDIPAMKMVNYKGGYSIVVYDKNKKRAQELVKQERAMLCVEANYQNNSNLDRAIKGIINKIVINTMLSKIR